MAGHQVRGAQRWRRPPAVREGARQRSCDGIDVFVVVACAMMDDARDTTDLLC